MGTRHLIGVVQGGAWKVAQYGQWDGYPDGQGVCVLRFLRSADMAGFAEHVAKCRFGSAAEIDAVYAPFTSQGGWMDMEQSDRFKKSPHAYLSRDTGSDILGLIAAAPDGLMLHDSHAFGADSLFCEWAYVVDLDGGNLEVYRGFQKNDPPEGERFAAMPVETESDYKQVHLAKVYPLSALPTDEQFLADLTEPEEAA